MTTSDNQATELWNAALDERIRAMDEPALQQAIARARAAPADQRPAPTESANADGGYRPPPNPTRDPAVRRNDILASIARKEAKMPAVDHNGVPIEGKLRWSR